MAIKFKLDKDLNIQGIEVDTASEATEILAKLSQKAEHMPPARRQVSSQTSTSRVEIPEKVRELLTVLASNPKGISGSEIASQLGIAPRGLGPLFGRFNRWAEERFAVSRKSITTFSRVRVPGTREYRRYMKLAGQFKTKLKEDPEFRELFEESG